MKVRIVIFGHDRTNTVKVLSRKQIDGKAFHFRGKVYFLDPNHFMVTWVRPLYRLGLPIYYSTFYYLEGFPKPLPLPAFDRLRTVSPISPEKLAEAAAKGQDVRADFGGIVNLGVDPGELAAMFNAWFYRIIAPQKLTLFEQIHLLISGATALGVFYLIVLVSGGF